MSTPLSWSPIPPCLATRSWPTSPLLRTTLVPSHDESVLNGYKATYTQYGTTLLHSNAGQVELLFSTTGTSSGADTIQIQVALQRPFSHGHLWINSTDPFAPPIIDPAYLSHPADMALLREGLKMARRLGATASLSSFIVEEVRAQSQYHYRR
jgi:choline dehydrogenase